MLPRIRHILATAGASVLVVALITASLAQGPGVDSEGRGGLGRGSGEILSLLNYPAVQEEINLRPDQKKKIDKVKEAVSKKRQILLSRPNNANGGSEKDGVAGGAMGSGNAEVTDDFGRGRFTPTPEMQSALDEMQGYSDSANANITRKILTKQQVARLTQIDLQRQGPMAVLNDDIALKLNISEDVLTWMRGIQNQSRQAKREIYLTLRQNGPTFQTDNGQLRRLAMQGYRDSPEWKAAQARMQQTTDQMQNQTIAQIGKLLSKNQKAKFKAMHGKDFDFTKLTNNPTIPPSPEAPVTTTPAMGQPDSRGQKRGHP